MWPLHSYSVFCASLSYLSTLLEVLQEHVPSCLSVEVLPPPHPPDLELSAHCLRAWAGITESRSGGTGGLRGCYRLARAQLQADSRETRPHGGWFKGCHAHAALFTAWQLVVYGTMMGSPCSCCLWPPWPSLHQLTFATAGFLHAGSLGRS